MVSDSLCFRPLSLVSLGNRSRGLSPAPSPWLNSHLSSTFILSPPAMAKQLENFVPLTFKYSPLCFPLKPWCCFCAASSLALVCQSNAFITKSFTAQMMNRHHKIVIFDNSYYRFYMVATILPQKKTQKTFPDV